MAPRWWKAGFARRWFLPGFPVAAAVALAALILCRQPAPTSSTRVPLQIHSIPWRAGQAVTLTVQVEPPRAGQIISLTVLAPGSGQPQVEGLSPEFFGLSGVQALWLLSEYREQEIALAAIAGARTISLDFEWRQLEPEAGLYDWEGPDQVLAVAKRYGLRLVPMLLYTPNWASTATFAPLSYQHAPPTDYADYRDFVYAVVDRYKPYGASPLTTDGYGITDWAIWNEPNLGQAGAAPEPGSFWTGSLEEYLLLLRAGYEGAHAADPGCNVLNGALADLSSVENDPYLALALERFYDPNGDGDAGDGARAFFDTLNFHTYQPGPPDAAWYEERMEAILKVMERFGDEQKGIWITETGYGSLAVPVAGSPLVDEQTQADAVRLLYETFAAYPQVDRVFWWSLRDYDDNGSAANTAMESHYGLLRTSFDPKPAYLSYARLTGNVGQVISMATLTDEDGLAAVSIPASLISRSGTYAVFATADGAPPTVVVTFEVAANEGGSH